MGEPSRCIHETNPAGGFGRFHKHLCAKCDADAICHARAGGWCGNLCGKCAAKVAVTIEDRLRGLEVEDEQTV